MNLKVSTTTADGGASVISVTGELDLSTLDQLAEPIQAVLSEGHRLILDLAPCSFIDSSGLRFVLRLDKELAADGREMAIVVADGQVRKLLHLTAIDQSVRVYPTLDDAVAVLGASGADGASATVEAPPSQTPG